MKIRDGKQDVYENWKNIVSDVRKLIHAGTDYLHTARKYYAHQNSLSAGEREYGQLNIERIKLHIELDKAELAGRKNMLAGESAKKYGVAALQDMLDRKEATTESTLFVNKEELEQVVSGLQAAIQHSTYPAPDAPLAKSKMVSPQEIVEELECRIKELQDKLRNDTDAAAYQEIVNKLALTENRFQRAVWDCRVAGSARDVLHAKNVELTEQLAGSREREAVANVALTHAHQRIRHLEDVVVVDLEKALARTTGVPILVATQQVKVE